MNNQTDQNCCQDCLKLQATITAQEKLIKTYEIAFANASKSLATQGKSIKKAKKLVAVFSSLAKGNEVPK